MSSDPLFKRCTKYTLRFFFSPFFCFEEVESDWPMFRWTRHTVFRAQNVSFISAYVGTLKEDVQKAPWNIGIRLLQQFSECTVEPMPRPLILMVLKKCLAANAIEPAYHLAMCSEEFGDLVECACRESLDAPGTLIFLDGLRNFSDPGVVIAQLESIPRRPEEERRDLFLRCYRFALAHPKHAARILPSFAASLSDASDVPLVERLLALSSQTYVDAEAFSSVLISYSNIGEYKLVREHWSWMQNSLVANSPKAISAVLVAMCALEGTPVHEIVKTLQLLVNLNADPSPEAQVAVVSRFSSVGPESMVSYADQLVQFWTGLRAAEHEVSSDQKMLWIDLHATLLAGYLAANNVVEAKRILVNIIKTFGSQLLSTSPKTLGIIANLISPHLCDIEFAEATEQLLECVIQEKNLDCLEEAAFPLALLCASSGTNFPETQEKVKTWIQQTPSAALRFRQTFQALTGTTN